MKNIEVLLNDLDEAYYDLGTRTGEPIEACSKWKDAHKEILSRFAEKDKRIAELEKLPQIKYIYGLITKIAELEKQIESLKCCENCKSFNHCQFLISDTDVIVKSSGNPFTVYTRLKKPENFDCDKWEERK